MIGLGLGRDLAYSGAQTLSISESDVSSMNKEKVNEVLLSGINRVCGLL